jgi:serine/threonine protein phosphatase PrpC
VAIKEYLPNSLALRKDGETEPQVSDEHRLAFRYGMKCFFEEGRALAKLMHPNVVRVLNFFRANGTVYMVMQFERGRTLHDYIQKHRGEVKEMLIRAVFARLLNGLREVHAHKLLHLDIKPSNIYLRNDGTPVLLDFGAARQTLASDQPVLKPMYTPGYAAPEQYEKDAQLGPWTDIYSVGASAVCLRHRQRAAARRRARDHRHAAAGRQDPGRPLRQPTARADRLVPAARPARPPAERVCAAEGADPPPRRRRPPRELVLGPGQPAQILHRSQLSEPAMRFTIYQESRTGKRASNQDRIAHCYSREALLMLVADGMGGHLHGELAAQIATQYITQAFQREARPRLPDPGLFLSRALTGAHHAILDDALDRLLPEAPRTTLVACVVQDGAAHWAHAGDSRLYLLRRGHIVTRTRDHSRTQLMIDQGLLQARGRAQPPRAQPHVFLPRRQPRAAGRAFAAHPAARRRRPRAVQRRRVGPDRRRQPRHPPHRRAC